MRLCAIYACEYGAGANNAMTIRASTHAEQPPAQVDTDCERTHVHSHFPNDNERVPRSFPLRREREEERGADSLPVDRAIVSMPSPRGGREGASLPRWRPLNGVLPSRPGDKRPTLTKQSRHMSFSLTPRPHNGRRLATETVILHRPRTLQINKTIQA